MINRTCTCPMQATRNGFVITGHDALCPLHGVAPPQPPKAAPEYVKPALAGVRYCEECGTEHPPDVRCDFVDEN